MKPLACRRCGNSVLVYKNSLAHTAIQWRDSSSCAVFALVPDLTERALLDGCAELRESIDDAVREGRVEVDVE